MGYAIVLKKYKGNKYQYTYAYGLKTQKEARSEAISYMDDPEYKIDAKTHYFLIYNDSIIIGRLFREKDGKYYWRPKKGGRFQVYKNGNLKKKVVA